MNTDILILGAGIGGYETFRTLAKLLKRHRINKQITIVDQNNYFTFVPMLHEAAAGSVEPYHCAIPLRELIYKTPHQFIKTTVKKIDPTKKIVETADGVIQYETCVVALGSGVNYFDTPGAEQHTYHVRSLKGALRLHYDVIELLEDNVTSQFTITVVGGGFTGVEVAGQFSDFIRKDMKELYPHMTVDIRLIETGELLAKSMHKRVQEKVTKRLRQMGVRLHLKSRVKEVKKRSIILDSGEELPSDITIWTTGFQNLATCFLSEGYCENGRVPVTGMLCHEKDSSLFALGDIMLRRDAETKIPFPQLAEAAHKEGIFVAHAIIRQCKKLPLRNFTFRPLGTLMPVGDWWGVMTLGKFILFGPLAWWIRRTVYLLFMPGLLRKLKIVIDWTLHSFGFRYILSVLPEDKKWRK